MNTATPRIFVGLCGGSGVRYGLRLARALPELGWGVDCCFSAAALKVLQLEEDQTLEPGLEGDLGRLLGVREPGLVRLYRPEQIDAPAASGSALRRGAVIIPCSMGTLGRVAHGYSSNLIERVCDVALKEGSPLVLVPRETPYSRIHLENMLRLVDAGAVILPASPGFYHRPRTIADLVDHLVGKVLDRLGIEHALYSRWGSGEAEEKSGG